VINELPVAKWTKDYKLALDEIMNEGEEKIVGLREYHTKDRVHFEIEMNESFFNSMYAGDGDFFKLEKFFKLSTSMSLKNMVGFTGERKLAKMPNVKSIFDMFYDMRLEFYEKRKDYLKSRIKRDLVEFE
jgi:DNA topoisomerase-2